MKDRTLEPLNRFLSCPSRGPDHGHRGGEVGRTVARSYAIFAAFFSLSLLAGCKEDGRDEPSAGPSPSAAPLPPPSAAPPEKVVESEPPKEEVKPEEPPPPHPGPWLWVKRSSAGIYPKPEAKRKAKLGYAQRGAKLPILDGKIDGSDCSSGWYQVVGGGYVCSLVGTTNEKDTFVKFRPRQPNIDEILPYPYARNAKNGTPLYRSMPSREQMYEYEPYLPGAKEAAEQATKEVVPVDTTSMASSLGAGGAPPEPEKRWWEKDSEDVKLHEVTLDQLTAEADGILAKRLVKGFYVAIDSTFKWKGRTWYKTTKGLVAPSERFWQTEGSDFKGVELGVAPGGAPGNAAEGSDQAKDAQVFKLPVGWVFGGRKSATTYEIDPETKKIKPKGSVKKFTAVQLTRKKIDIGKKTYFEAEGGEWLRDLHIRTTTPAPRPSEVGENERWIDVDISEQTLVAFQGDTPVYATLISSGKESTVKEKDHRTPRGMWRIREKHVTATMDGDGSAAGDLPYSIEDVPYVMYFHKSYATHAAFWHRNYGVKMSHGCVNLAPLDAKHLFYFAEPRAPEGWHGVWSRDDQPGSMVVVHD